MGDVACLSLVLSQLCRFEDRLERRIGSIARAQFERSGWQCDGLWSLRRVESEGDSGERKGPEFRRHVDRERDTNDEAIGDTPCVLFSRGASRAKARPDKRLKGAVGWECDVCAYREDLTDVYLLGPNGEFVERGTLGCCAGRPREQRGQQDTYGNEEVAIETELVVPTVHIIHICFVLYGLVVAETTRDCDDF